MLCPKCNHEISDNAKFCSECGTNIKEYLEKLEKEKYIKCTNCAKKIEKDASFCKYCGAKIEKENLTIAKVDKEVKTAFFIIGVGILAIIFQISNEYYNFGDFGFSSSNSSAPMEQSQATIEVINSHLTNIGYGTQKIEGIIKNNSPVVCEHPNVEIYTFDSNGNRVGEHPIITMNALNPDETYKFTIYANGASSYSVETCSCYY